MSAPPAWLDSFFVQLSHDLRSPLNSILMWCDLMGREDTSREAFANGLAAIANSARLQVQLIEELTDAALLCAEPGVTEAGWISWPGMADGLSERVKGHCLRRGVEFEHQPDNLDQIFADAHRLERTLLNLLLHCIHFTAKGGKVVFGGEKSGDEVVIRIVDTGKAFESTAANGASDANTGSAHNARTRSNDRRLLMAQCYLQHQGGRLEIRLDETVRTNHLSAFLPQAGMTLPIS